MRKVVIYGGAFSPPHLGHASVIEAVLRLFPCDEIWIMPSADRHDKKMSASGDHRVKMWQIMLKELFWEPKIPIKLSSVELERGKKTSTYETHLELKNKFSDNEFNFIIGSDILNDLPNWINGEKILKEVRFIAMKKPNGDIPEKLPKYITALDDVVWDNVSSTFLRKLISSGYSGIPYLTKGVAEYIQKNNLYK